MYTLNDFDFELPERLIAQRPAEPRDHSRLLVYNRRTRTITDDVFYNLGHWLPAQSTIVVNNSKVEKARMVFGNTEIFILRQVNDRLCEALVRPGKKFRAGRVVHLAEGLQAKVLEVQQDGVRVLELSPSLTDPAWEPCRLTPFPPYIGQDESLADSYQTVYARDEGSKAAPTAGLHFTDGLLNKLRSEGHTLAELTLHVGMGTFAPVKADRIEDHVMHSEWYSLDEKTASELNQARHIVAVGTTSARTLESVVQVPGTRKRAGYLTNNDSTTVDSIKQDLNPDSIGVELNDEQLRLSSGTGMGAGFLDSIGTDSIDSEFDNSPLTLETVADTVFRTDNGVGAVSSQEYPSLMSAGRYSKTPHRSFPAGSGTTDIFIRPGYNFGAVDSLITNFHLPKSTLLMLVSALCSVDEMHRIYAHAIKNEYRFYSFGDAMLLL
jgi:S-adenosylmethionine:tRNA ribosyltransferase-isomerase